MPIPTYDQFIEPLLRYLAAHRDGAPIGTVADALAAQVGLTDDDRAELLPSRAQPVYRNRIGWAHDRLKRAGLSSSPRRGFWQLTADGVAFASKHKRLTADDIEQLATVERGHRLRAKPDGEPVEHDEPPTLERVSPEERIDAALAEVRDSVARDLLENIAQAPPGSDRRSGSQQSFEKLVLDLLLAMGYGADRSDVQRVGGSGDGGIDGIISLDRLGLEKVYIQAKRWKNTVGSPDIQGFMGALQLQAAAKGVFLTTSDFSKAAREAAGKARGTVILVDGKRLTQLMIDHGVGVSHKPVKVPRVDSDYFEEG